MRSIFEIATIPPFFVVVTTTIITGVTYAVIPTGWILTSFTFWRGISRTPLVGFSVLISPHVAFSKGQKLVERSIILSV
jgi:hypothetical protein